MEIKLNFRSRTPIYQQIMHQIKLHIASGSLQPGDQLPTVRALAQDLRVNFNTVARAYRALDEEEILSTQHGRGTYILEPERKADRESLRNHLLLQLTRDFIKEGANLGFSPNELRTVLDHQILKWEIGQIE